MKKYKKILISSSIMFICIIVVFVCGLYLYNIFGGKQKETKPVDVSLSKITETSENYYVATKYSLDQALLEPATGDMSKYPLGKSIEFMHSCFIYPKGYMMELRETVVAYMNNITSDEQFRFDIDNYTRLLNAEIEELSLQKTIYEKEEMLSLYESNFLRYSNCLDLVSKISNEKSKEILIDLFNEHVETEIEEQLKGLRIMTEFLEKNNIEYEIKGGNMLKFSVFYEENDEENNN